MGALRFLEAEPKPQPMRDEASGALEKAELVSPICETIEAEANTSSSSGIDRCRKMS